MTFKERRINQIKGKTLFEGRSKQKKKKKSEQEQNRNRRRGRELQAEFVPVRQNGKLKPIWVSTTGGGTETLSSK